jgi:aminoglycoside phosphotransferase family enzyme/predicted kinase
VTVPAEQREVAAFLGGLSSGRSKETHISVVFIGEDTVWKLKKAVRLPFLDFSTLQARHRFLRRELGLNKPAAPGIYRDVVAVVRQSDGTLALCLEPGDASVVDWVLRMAPVPDEDFLDVMASRGALSSPLLDALGDCVATYHAQLPPVTGWDSPAAMLRLTQGNARSAVAAGLPIAEVRAWQYRTEAAVRKLGPWFAERATAGFVRRCHGDLHLGNLCLWNGVPVPFDALEFDEAMATIDVGYDLAFLLMDLDRRVNRAAANRVMNRAIARTGDAGATRGFPLFLSQRALVRSHVSAASGQMDDAKVYLEAALDYLSPPPAFVLASGGLPGSGKSTLARMLAPDLGAAPGALLLRSDEIRKRLHSVAPEARLPQRAYSAEANAAVNKVLLDQVREVAEGGHAVILDATFIGQAMRLAVAAATREMSVPFLGVWLDVPLAELERRVASRLDDASDATVDILRRVARADLGSMDWLEVDARDTAQAAAAIRQAVGTQPVRAE